MREDVSPDKDITVRAVCVCVFIVFPRLCAFLMCSSRAANVTQGDKSAMSDHDRMCDGQGSAATFTIVLEEKCPSLLVLLSLFVFSSDHMHRFAQLSLFGHRIDVHSL